MSDWSYGSYQVIRGAKFDLLSQLQTSLDVYTPQFGV